MRDTELFYCTGRFRNHYTGHRLVLVPEVWESLGGPSISPECGGGIGKHARTRNNIMYAAFSRQLLKEECEAMVKR